MRRAFPLALITLIACGPSFYQAPPSVVNYPERVATKKWWQLLNEAAPRSPGLPAEAGLEDVYQKVAEIQTPEKRVAELDRLLAENRVGTYSSLRANFLHELREIVATEGLFDSSAGYIKWRIQQDAFPIAPPQPVSPPDVTEDDYQARLDAYQAQVHEWLTLVDEHIAGSSPALLPYWKVQRAAFFLKIRSYPEADAGFTSVAGEYPEHPRGEVAMLMLGRCKRNGVEIENAYLAFLSRYPNSRFTSDAEGWLGGAAFNRGQLGAAVRWQVARLERQPTREVIRSVLRECDMIFDKAFQSVDPDDDFRYPDPNAIFDAASVARNPLITRLFVQHCIDPAADIMLPTYWEDYSGARRTLDLLRLRILSPKPFVSYALRELGKELLASKAKPDALTLVLLAWAATEEGENEQALGLLARIPEDKTTDETLQVRALVLQRLGRHGEAVAAFDTLASRFPDSPLGLDIPYQRSLSLFRAGRTGEAITGLIPIVFPEPQVISEGDDIPPVLHPTSEPIQWLDTLIQFSPLEELEAAFPKIQGNARGQEALRTAIVRRALAAHRFEIASRYLWPDEGSNSGMPWQFDLSVGTLPMTAAEWNQRAALLAEFYQQLEGSQQEPAIHLSIAREWMKQRGRLTLPAGGICDYSASETEKLDLLRRRNAIELGFDRAQVNRELDLRDEATHALEHSLLAAKSDDPTIAAPALELANECISRRQEYSLYRNARAVETNDSGLSLKIHNELILRFPESEEAKRSCRFEFISHIGPWMPGDYSPSNSAYLATRIMLMREDPPNPYDDRHAPDRSEDLKVAASLPGISPGELSDYQNERYLNLPPVFKSFIEFRKLAKSRELELADTPLDTAEDWKRFLDTYPDSPKAEAASLRMTRLICRGQRGAPVIRAVGFPEAPIAAGYKHVETKREGETFDPSISLSAIEAHEKRFPQGRYRDNLNLLRVGALIDSGDFTKSLALLEPILSNPHQPDLQTLATLEFMDIAQRLMIPEQRGVAAGGFRKTPGAMPRLERLVNGDTFLSRLKPMMGWLSDPG